jgi:SAM-dependent methyltransferase
MPVPAPDPAPNPGKVRAGYDRVASRYADELEDELTHRPLERALLGALGELAGLDANPGLVADLGAGPGHIARHVRQLGLDVVAIDLSPAMAAIAVRRNGVPAAAGSLVALPIADGSLAAAVVFYAVIHLDDAALEACAAELARVLRGGGVAIVSIHVGTEVRHLDEWWGEPVDLDFRFFEPATITAVLDAAGLTVEATLARAPIPDVETQTHRAYLIARKV